MTVFFKIHETRRFPRTSLAIYSSKGAQQQKDATQHKKRSSYKIKNQTKDWDLQFNLPGVMSTQDQKIWKDT